MIIDWVFLDATAPPQWVMASSFTWFLDHTQRRTTVGRTPLDDWSARHKDLFLTTHNTHKRENIQALGGIRTHNPSKISAVDPRLRPRGHWDRPLMEYGPTDSFRRAMNGTGTTGSRTVVWTECMWQAESFTFLHMRALLLGVVHSQGKEACAKSGPGVKGRARFHVLSISISVSWGNMVK